MNSKRIGRIFALVIFGGAAWTLGAEPGPVGHSAPSAGRTSVPAPSAAPAQVAQHTENTAPRASGSGEHHNDGTGEHGGHRNRPYPMLYGDPWWDNSNGWNSGWSGDGTYDDVYYNDPGSDGGTYSAPTPPSPDSSASAVSAQLTNAMDKSPAMVSADGEVQLAQVTYDKERERVLAGLSQTQQYQQAVSRQHDAAHDLHLARLSPTSKPAILNAATAKMDAADEVTKMQEQAIATDPAASQAKLRLAESVIQRDTLRAKLLSHH